MASLGHIELINSRRHEPIQDVHTLGQIKFPDFSMTSDQSGNSLTFPLAVDTLQLFIDSVSVHNWNTGQIKQKQEHVGMCNMPWLA